MKLIQDEPVYSWQFESGINGVGVEVKAHYVKGVGWCWCWYINISSRHESFNRVREVESLSFHCGWSYSKNKTEAHNAENVGSYRWMQPFSIITVGCDFNHLYDSLTGHAPSMGIPFEVESNVELVMLEFKRLFGVKIPSYQQPIVSYSE